MSSLKLHKEFLNEIKNEEKDINEPIFRKYFNYQYPSFLVKSLSRKNQNKTVIAVKYLNESLIDLRNSINSEEIPENENSKKVVTIVEKSSTLINNKEVKKLKF